MRLGKGLAVVMISLGLISMGFGFSVLFSTFGSIPERTRPGTTPLPAAVLEGAALMVAGTALGLLAQIAARLETHREGVSDGSS
jgi:hypothetical protein